MLCRNLNLFSQLIIAIDDSKFKAVNNRDRNFTQGKIKVRMQQIEQSIDRYLAAMDSADRAAPEVAEAKAEGLSGKIEKFFASVYGYSGRCRGPNSAGRVWCPTEVDQHLDLLN